MRTTIRIVAILGLLVSLGFGCVATYLWLTPSEEDHISESMAREARNKAEEAMFAKDTTERTKLEQEALDRMTSARLWAEGARDRLRTNRLGVLACAGGALVSVVLFVLTRKRRPAIP